MHEPFEGHEAGHDRVEDGKDSSRALRGRDVGAVRTPPRYAHYLSAGSALALAGRVPVGE